EAQKKSLPLLNDGCTAWAMKKNRTFHKYSGERPVCPQIPVPKFPSPNSPNSVQIPSPNSPKFPNSSGAPTFAPLTALYFREECPSDTLLSFPCREMDWTPATRRIASGECSDGRKRTVPIWTQEEIQEVLS